MDSSLDALLKSQPALWRGRDRYQDDRAIPTGFAALDQALPARGWCVGGVTELLTRQSGIGELSLLLPGLSQITSNDQWAAVISPPHIPYAPALGNAGVRLDRLLIIDSQNDADTLWATEQVLRSGLFCSVIAWVERSTAQQQRRLQLAAENGACWATIYRPLHECKQHSPVSMRMTVQCDWQQSRQQTSGQQLLLDIIKVRGGQPQQVSINPIEFDQFQGAEWPVPRPLLDHPSHNDMTPRLRGIS